MDTRFPPLTPQSRLETRMAPRVLALPAAPSLPWGEWVVAAVAFLCLIAT